jgi:1-acyl-sn-glycerol-3-phosphate acyltransferase
LNFLARQSLFVFPPLRWLITSLDAIPIDREGSGLGGLKETLKRLKRAELVLMFPEGTRTPNGEVRPFKPGFCALARRAGVPLLPVGLDGAFSSWPRWRHFPRPGVVHIQFGPPLLPHEIARLDDVALVAEIETRVRVCHATAKAARLRAIDS